MSIREVHERTGVLVRSGRRGAIVPRVAAAPSVGDLRRNTGESMTQHLVPNANLWLVTPEEAGLLRQLEGKYLSHMYPGVVCAALAFEHALIWVIPESGRGGSPLRPRSEEIIRVSVRPISETDWRVVDLVNGIHTRKIQVESRVAGIKILNSLVLFTEPIREEGHLKVGPFEFPFPAGVAYSTVVRHPLEAQKLFADELRERATQGLVNQVDIGILLEMENHEQLVLFSPGGGYVIEVCPASSEKNREYLDAALAIALEERLTGGRVS